MQTKGSSGVVINEREEVLLVLRQDFRIWALPGGVEPDETWEQAAVRESLEKTGYQIEIKQYVGEYWRPQMSHGHGDRRHVFLAQAIDVRWFPATSLPKGMFRFSREHIYDALARPSTPLKKSSAFPRGCRDSHCLSDPQSFDKILSIKDNRQEKG